MPEAAVDWTALSSGEVVKQWAELSPEEKRSGVAAVSDAELEVLREELTAIEIDRLEREASEAASGGAGGRLPSPSAFLRSVCRTYVDPQDRPDDLVRNLYVLVALGTIPGYHLVYDRFTVDSPLLDYSGMVVVGGGVFYILTTLVAVRRGAGSSTTIADCLNRISELAFLLALTVGIALFLLVWASP